MIGFFENKYRQTICFPLWQKMCCLPTQIPATTVVAGKSGLWVFLPKNICFPNHFNHKTPYKHFYNTKKPIYQYIKPKKRSKPLNRTRNKELAWWSKSSPTKRFFCLCRNPATPLSSPMRKELKNKKTLSLVSKLYFFKKIKGPATLQQKRWGAKMYIINKFESATYVTRIFYFGPLSFNSTLPLKKPCNCVFIWAEKGSIMQRKKIEDQIENFK